MDRDEIRDQKLKEFFKNDQVISDKANRTFDSFISEIENTNDDIKEETKNSKGKIYAFRRILAVAASLMVVFIGSNAYATHLGYENIFFMIKELYTSKTTQDETEIFSDRDIIISYQSFLITDGIEMQVNELQIKDNKAKLFMFVNESKSSTLTPFEYKVYNEAGDIMCNTSSSKKSGSLQYSEILELNNYIENMKTLTLEIYSSKNVLLKTVTVDLENKILEAKSAELKPISEIKLNEFLSKQTLESYEKNEIKNKQILILKNIDIMYENGIYITKYLYCIPSEEDLKEGNVENLDMYINSIKFNMKSDEFELLEIDKPEKIELE